MGCCARVAVAAVALVIGAGVANGDRRSARDMFAEGMRAIERGSESQALGRFEAAIAEDPDFLPAYDAAIPLWIAADKLPTLIKHLEIATTRQADYAFAWYTLAYAYRRGRRFELAVMAYETYIELRPKDPDAHYGLALALIELKNKPRAINELRKYLVLEGRAERARWVADARTRLEAMGAPIPPRRRDRSVGSELARSETLIGEMRFASALAVLDHIKPIDRAGRGEVWRLRARAHLGAGRVDAAIAAGFVALGLRAGDAAVLDALADAFAAAGRGAVAEYMRKIAGAGR